MLPSDEGRMTRIDLGSTDLDDRVALMLLRFFNREWTLINANDVRNYLALFLRGKTLLKLGLFVECGVEFRVVIHLELKVDAEAASTASAVLQESGEAEFEILYLFFYDVELERALVDVLLASVGAIDFLFHMELLEGEDGKAVDGHAGSFGVHRGVVREIVADLGEYQLVHLFDEVVALLVVVVDGPFGLVDKFEALVLASGVVLVVPEGEVVLVIGLDQGNERVFRIGRAVFAMPTSSEFGLQVCDRGRVYA